MKLDRSIGICLNEKCEKYGRSVMLVNQPCYHCPHCAKRGKHVAEVGSYTGDPSIFQEVRVEFDYDVSLDSYRQTAIVRDDELRYLVEDPGIYTFKSPLIRTDVRALKSAESLLSILNLGGGLEDGQIPTMRETILSFDEPREDFLDRLELLEGSWLDSKYRHLTSSPRGKSDS